MKWYSTEIDKVYALRFFKRRERGRDNIIWEYRKIFMCKNVHNCVNYNSLNQK